MIGGGGDDDEAVVVPATGAAVVGCEAPEVEASFLCMARVTRVSDEVGCRRRLVVAGGEAEVGETGGDVEVWLAFFLAFFIVIGLLSLSSLRVRSISSLTLRLVGRTGTGAWTPFDFGEAVPDECPVPFSATVVR